VEYSGGFVIDFMQSYASYFRGQTQEWFAKSVKSLAGVGSDRSDPQHATFLLDQTQPVLVAALQIPAQPTRTCAEIHRQPRLLQVMSHL
jgi:hypothetical protein